MLRFRLIVIVGAALGAAGPWCQAAPQGAPPVSLEQDLKAQYPFGTLLIVRKEGLVGVNSGCSQPNIFTFKNGQLHAPGMLQKLDAASSGPCETRPFPVGSKVLFASYIAVVPRTSHVLVGGVVQCDGCDSPAQDQRTSAATGESPSFRLGVLFQFPKGFLLTATLSAVQEVIGQVFAVDTSANAGAGSPTAPSATQGITGARSPATLGPVYISSQSADDKLVMKADGSFSLFEGGQAYTGSYSVTGATLKLHIDQLQKDVEIAIQGNRLLVNGSEIWVQPGQ